MVELSTGQAAAFVAGAGGVLLLLAAALLASVRRRRSAERRLAAVAARLEPAGPTPDGEGRDVVSRLERVAEAAALRLSDADARAERLLAALEGVADAVVVCDEHLAVVHRNRAATDLGDGPGPVADAVHAALAAARSGGRGGRDVELAGPPPRVLRVTADAVDDGRRLVGVVGVVRDVSDTRRLEAARRDFLADVSGELKGPAGALGLLAATLVAEDDPTLTRRLAARLEQDALAFGRLVDDLTELGRLDAEALPARDAVAVDLLVAQAVEVARGRAGGGPVAVEAGAGLRVVGDRRQLVSALGHLVGNALRASPPSAPVRVTAAAENGWVDVAVADDGAGIPAGDLDRVFACFYRAGAGAGTGVGLAIAARVAGNHGGRVSVVSADGAGSTFTLRLPSAD